MPTIAVVQQAPAVPPIPVTQAVPVAPPPAPAPAALKPLTLSADSHQSIALVTLASEPDAEEPEIADLAPTMADAQLPVIRELEQLLAGIDRARQAIDALSA
jgi:hypothetical protein